MKFLFLATLFAPGAFAYSPATVSLRASENTCAQIDQALQTYGKVFVIDGNFFAADTGYTASLYPMNCGANKMPGSATVLTADGTYCRLENICRFRPNHHRRRHRR